MGTPFMQFYVADYIADTMHLTTEEHGAYLLILMAMWRVGGKLASDDVTMRQVCKVTQKRWTALRPRIVAMLEDTGDGHFTQKRLAEEHEKSVRTSAARKASGAAGGKISALKRKGVKAPKTTGTLKHLPEPDTRTKEVKEKKGAGAPVLPGMQFPTWWPVKEWQGFVESRKKLRKPLSDRAVELAIKRLTELKAAGQDPGAVLDAATMGSWTGLYPVKEAQGGPRLAASEGVTIDQWVYRLVAWYVGHPDDGLNLEVPKGYWDRRWGDKRPGDPGFDCPPEAWAAFTKAHPVNAA